MINYNWNNITEDIYHSLKSKLIMPMGSELELLTAFSGLHEDHFLYMKMEEVRKEWHRLDEYLSTNEFPNAFRATQLNP